VLLGGAEVNTLDGGYGEDYIEGGPGDDTLIGGYDTDVASYWLTDGSVTVDLAAGTATGVDGADTLSGFEDAHGSDGYGDTLSGDDWANVLKGWAGDDLLRGRGGDDVLEGGDGVDRAIYDDAPGGVNVFLHLGMANGAASSDDLAGIEDLTGSAFDDTLTGDAAANRIEGGDGDDNIYGREGDDLLDGGEGVDTANYWDAPAFVVVDLGSGQAALGGGTDTLTGFENVGGSSFGDQLIGDEEITDFVSRSDVINLSAIDTDAGAPGDQAFTFIGTDAFSATAVDEVRFSAGVIYVDTDNDVGAEMAIALTGVASVTAADFVL
jgi:Ca2+-binding RTX toxin-like protein